MFGSRDFSLKVKSISKRFTVLERIIKMRNFLCYKPLDVFASRPRKRGSNGLAVAHALRTAIFVLQSSSSRVDALACMNVFGTNDSKHYRQQSFWDECHRAFVSHCPHQLVGFLLWYSQEKKLGNGLALCHHILHRYLMYESATVDASACHNIGWSSWWMVI